MATHFPEAMITGFEPLVAAMTTAPSDRHVLAAAVRGQAEVIVTENLRDFHASSTDPYDVSVMHQDEFLLDLHDLDASAVRRALTRQVTRYRRRPRTVVELLAALGGRGNGCVRFAENARVLRLDRAGFE